MTAGGPWNARGAPAYAFGLGVEIGICVTCALHALLQVWATFLADREGAPGTRSGTATVHEAMAAHELFAAALASHPTDAAASGYS